MSFVLDNVILSSFYSAGWFDSLAFYSPEDKLRVPERIWTAEFLPDRDVDSAPEWLTVQSVTELPETGVPGALSEADKTCLALAERHSDVLVTNDKKLVETAKARDVATKWGTRFVIETFEQCGISQTAFDAGVEAYRDDIYLPNVVAEKLMQAEKP